MTSGNEIFLEWALCDDKRENIMEMSYGITMLQIEAQTLVESTGEEYSQVFQEAVAAFVKTVVDAIDQIIKDIAKFLGDCVKRFKEVVSKDAIKNKLKNGKVMEDIEINDTEAQRKLLDEYLREMLKLERRLMMVSGKATFLSKSSNPEQTRDLIEVQKIMREMDKLDAKYDSDFLEANSKIIKIASKDAVRYADHVIDKLQVDYDAVEKGSKEILQKFKVDAQGCKVPEHANFLQKMSRRISGKVRKYASQTYDYNKLTLGKIISGTVIATGVGAYIKLNQSGAFDKKSYSKKGEW